MNGFINSLSIPVKIKEKIENENIEIIGEIDTLIMNESNFIEEIKLEYGIDIEDYEFSYKLNLRKSREKIKTIEIQINLKLGKRYEINERIIIM